MSDIYCRARDLTQEKKSRRLARHDQQALFRMKSSWGRINVIMVTIFTDATTPRRTLLDTLNPGRCGWDLKIVSQIRQLWYEIKEDSFVEATIRS
jgi:hypothetical protein